MHRQHSYFRIVTLLLGAAALVFAGWANAASGDPSDPPGRVARLSYTTGQVSFLPVGGDEWVLASVNRPLTTGDRLWTDAGARAELQIGSVVIRMGAGTSATLLNLDDRVAQLQITQGTVHVRVRRIGPNDVVEIATPNLAYVARKPGVYRVDVDPSGNATTVATRSGEAEAYGEGAAYKIAAGQSYRFAGADLRDSQRYQVPADEFEGWATERSRRAERSTSARYVSPDVIGYEDLDEHGRWQTVEGHGNMWVPNRVPTGWRPYHDGHWAHVQPWGWTWVDDQPWGFAPSHYGRWAHVGGRWGWVPGPARSRAVYAPALVAFVGGSNFSVSLTAGQAAPAVAWFPLGPREVYRPPYRVSRNYINNVNTSNTTVNHTNITNVYNTKNVTNVYVNQRVPGAVTAVPRTAFVQSQSVSKASVAVTKETATKAQVSQNAEVAPERASTRGGAAKGSQPPAEAQTRTVVAKSKPPAPRASSEPKPSSPEAKSGKGAEPAAPAGAKPATGVAAASSVKVVSPTKPTTAPPQKQAAAGSAEKGSQPADAQKAAPTSKDEKGKKAPASTAKSSEPQKDGQPQPEAQKASSASKDEKGKKAKSSEPQKEGQPQPEAQKASPASKDEKGKKAKSSEPLKATQPAETKQEPAQPPAAKKERSRPPEAQTEGSQPPEAKKKERARPPEAKKERQEQPEAQKDRSRPPEAKKERQQQPEAQKERAQPPEAKKERQQQPEAQKERAQPPEAKKERQQPASKDPDRETRKAAPKQPEAEKSAEKSKAAEKSKGKKQDDEKDK